jgi:hypothetical protein
VPDEVIKDVRKMPLPPDVVPGEYRVEIGLYNPLSGERLSVLDSAPRASENAILLREPFVIAP